MLPDEEAWKASLEAEAQFGDPFDPASASPSQIFSLAFPENWYAVGDDPQPCFDRIIKFCAKHGCSEEQKQAALAHAQENWDVFVEHYKDNPEDPGAGSILDPDFGQPPVAS
jgi:hypothetical protein